MESYYQKFKNGSHLNLAKKMIEKWKDGEPIQLMHKMIDKWAKIIDKK
jgi:hypothetical protein